MLRYANHITTKSRRWTSRDIWSITRLWGVTTQPVVSVRSVVDIATLACCSWRHAPVVGVYFRAVFPVRACGRIERVPCAAPTTSQSYIYSRFTPQTLRAWLSLDVKWNRCYALRTAIRAWCTTILGVWSARAVPRYKQPRSVISVTYERRHTFAYADCLCACYGQICSGYWFISFNFFPII